MSTPQPEPRRERRVPVRTLGAVSASVLAFPLASVHRRRRDVPLPDADETLPCALDVAPGYQKGTRCLTENQPGAVAFAKLLNATYGSRTYGILRTCAAEHGEGRALDWMINANNAEQLALANALTRWLAAPDAKGRPGAMAKRFGINYIIWNRQMWRAYDPGRGWTPVLRRLAAHRPHPLLVQLGRRVQAHVLVERRRGDHAAHRPRPRPRPRRPPPSSRRAATRCSSRAPPAPTSRWRRRSSASPPTASSAPSRRPRSAPGRRSTACRPRRSSTTPTWSKMVTLKLIPSRAGAPAEQYVNVVLKRGSTGEAVKALQKAIGQLTVDGSYGPATESRVKEYQKSKGLTVTRHHRRQGVERPHGQGRGARAAPAPAPAHRPRPRPPPRPRRHRPAARRPTRSRSTRR